MTVESFSDEDLIICRLAELVDHRTPWHRSLWQIGSMLTLKEVLEYADGVRSGIAKSEGLSYVTQSAATTMRRDLGLGRGPVRDEIVKILDLGAKKDGVLDEATADSLGQFVRRAETDYLSNWLSAHTDGVVGSSDVEFMARSIVAHLLDAGFAADHLHGWLRAVGDGTELKLASIVSQAEEMYGRDPVAYTVYVPFSTLPSEVIGAAGTRFLSWGEFESALDVEGFPRPKIRSGAGALMFAVSAREPKAAIANVEIEVRRLVARVAVGLSASEVIPAGVALATPAARPRWRDLRSRRRDILLSSITRHHLLLPAARAYDTRALDDAFELLAAAETATSWTSVAAMWAAVEGLHTRPGDPGVAAADRMASVVAGGFVRAELTQLVDVLARGEDDLGALMRSTELPLASKMDTALHALGSELGPEVDSPSDAAALARVRNLRADPAAAMHRVRGYYRDAFRRLYMQRNLLLHGGRFDSVALPATMRTLPSLVAAGLDRLVHGAMQVPSTDPFALAARADNELLLLGSTEGRSLHRLLD